MKAIALIIAVGVAVSLAACGPSSEMKGMDKKTASKDSDMKGMDMSKGSDMKGMDHSTMKMEGKTGTHKSSASVKSLDANAQTVTLDHGPVASMNWPAMTMSFKVKDKTMLDKLQVGSKVDVEFVQQGGDYVITDVK